MKYLLDTNICIYVINGRDKKIIPKIQKIGFENIFISSITIAELEYGIANSSKPIESRIALLEFLLPFDILDFTAECCPHYGKIRKTLKTKGVLIGNMDLLIASIALARKLIVVTNNLHEFERVPDLKSVNWFGK